MLKEQNSIHNKKSGALMNKLQEKIPQSHRVEIRSPKNLKRKRKSVFKPLILAFVAAIILCVLLSDTSDKKGIFDNQSKIEYRNEAKEERYASYRKENPHLSEEEIVWHVNANLDKPKYEYDIPVSGYDDPYIIVNKYYKVPEDYRPHDLKRFDGQLLRVETGNAYMKMRDDALKEGLNIHVVSGYRSVEYQEGLYNRYLSSDSRENVDRYSARPGYSEHHTGMAMDVFGSQDGLRNFENTPEYSWVKENCYKYGFIIRYLAETEDITGYEAEPWHLRYVGVKVSTEMKEKNIKSFEEYCAKYLQ